MHPDYERMTSYIVCITETYLDNISFSYIAQILRMSDQILQIKDFVFSSICLFFQC